MVVPTYNPGDFLIRCLESVLAQSMADLEVVVVDDGSYEPQGWVTDLDPRVAFVRQDNRGVSVARNVGVAAAGADWVAFLDQDDEWLPDKLAMQLDLVGAQPRAAFYCTGFDWVRRDEVVHADFERLSYRGLLSTQTALLSSALIARADYEAVGGLRPAPHANAGLGPLPEAHHGRPRPGDGARPARPLPPPRRERLSRLRHGSCTSGSRSSLGTSRGPGAAATA